MVAISRIGILGGTFDPIHYSHLYMGELAADELGLDKVIYVPSGVSPHKKDVRTPARIRLEMTKIATAGNVRFAVCDYEVNKNEVCYTVDTLDYLRGIYPDAHLFFIMGEDSLGYIETWRDAARLLGQCEFVVIGRGGCHVDIQPKIDALKHRFGGVFHYIKAPETYLSSEAIRARLQSGRTVKYLLPDCLITYIENNGIYKSEF